LLAAFGCFSRKAPSKALNIQSLLRYDGPSTRQIRPEAMARGQRLGSWCYTTEAEARMDRILSSQGIPFCVELSGSPVRAQFLYVVVPQAQQEQARKLLDQAACAGLLQAEQWPGEDDEDRMRKLGVIE
jgi:hypothetical protein